MARQYGNADPDPMTFVDFKRTVSRGEAPDFIKYLISKALVTGIKPGDERKFNNIKIEKIDVFASHNVRFAFDCNYGNLEIRYECEALATRNSTGLPMWRITKSLVFNVYVPSTDEMHKSTFDGRGREVGQETIQNYGKPGSKQRSVMANYNKFEKSLEGLSADTDMGMGVGTSPDTEFTRLARELNDAKPVVAYRPREKRFACSCASVGKRAWCVHLDAYLDAGLDAPTLASVVMNDKLQSVDIDYPLAQGLAFVKLTLEKFTEREVLGNESDSVMLKLSWKDLSVWDSGGDLCGDLILSQIKGTVRNSSEYDDWTRRVKHGFVLTNTACKNSFHKRSDTDVFDTMRKDAKLPEDKDAVAFVNAFHSIYDGCCLACFQVRSRMANDVPRY